MTRPGATGPIAVKIRAKGVAVVPVLSYSHDYGSCSIIGGYVYRGAQIGAARGRYFFGDFCSGLIWSFRAGAQNRKSAIVRQVEGQIPDLVSFGEGADGELYAVSIDGNIDALR